MLGVDVGSSVVKVLFLGDDDTIKVDSFAAREELIRSYFTNTSDRCVANFIAPSELKKWIVVGAGSLKYAEFFDALPIRPDRGHEMTSNSTAVSYLLKRASHVHVFGGSGRVSERYIIASMGTGIAFTLNEPGVDGKHVGGTGLGGGTLMALSKLILGITDFGQLCELARRGSAAKVDLLISDIVGADYGSTLKADVVASSLAKVALFDERPADNDLAAGLIATVTHAIGAHAAAVCKAEKVDTVVLAGGFLDIGGIVTDFLVRSINIFQKEVTIVVPNFHHHLGALGAALALRS
jgi:type II pantothenate kinase